MNTNQDQQLVQIGGSPKAPPPRPPEDEVEKKFLIRRDWVYPADVSGRFRKTRKIVGYSLLAFFVLMPWIPVGGMPAVRVDIPGRQLTLLGQLFTPHDTWALALLGLMATIVLFFMASVFGRVWCGWACPQTVWLDWVYRPIERAIEGKSNKRRKWDSKPKSEWPASWWARKAAKWVAFALATGVATGIFMSWFVGGPELLRGEFGSGAITVGAGLYFVFFLDAVWFREQLCLYACPYARFQGALMSEKSLVVAYDEQRGEPRVKGKNREGGDCISCNRCVQVCPSGIDIREGDQLSCIACASCIDACDEVMLKIGKPKGLIRYTTDRDATGVKPLSVKTLGRRSFLYLGILSVLLGGLVVGVVTRSPVKIAVARAVSGAIYNELPDGRVSNQITINVSNRGDAEHGFTVTSPTEGIEMTVPGQPWTIASGHEQRMTAFVVAPRAAFAGGRLPMEVQVDRDDGLPTTATFTLLGPSADATR
ncbi:MAG: cytochrome c oxidase accessory protein CcoG [Deltaproteobacteria bacterium]|nr:cytochrome c oxidase accessory protein CcoG [Deltaproteobacteria bacterium]